MEEEIKSGDTCKGASLEELITNALTGPLPAPQQQQIINELSADPKLVYQCGLTPSKLPKLVENNTLIAVQVLSKLMDSPEIADYFGVFLSMDLSLRSLEVVNRLSTAVELPKEFVHTFITNCFSSCGQIKDEHMQIRFVKLVCIFLQGMIRCKIIDVKDLFVEIHGFCIEFSRIREAVTLFRFLKSLE